MKEGEMLTQLNSWIVDPSTGELFQEKQDEVIYMAPLDISSILSREDYNEVVKERVGRRKFKLSLSPILLDVITDKVVSIPAISVFCLLGQKIEYATMVYTSMKDLVDGTGYTRQTIGLALKELITVGLIKEPNPKLKYSNDRFIVVNPLYFYLGYYYNRDNAIRDWFKK